MQVIVGYRGQRRGGKLAERYGTNVETQLTGQRLCYCHLHRLAWASVLLTGPYKVAGRGSSSFVCRTTSLC